MDKALSDLRNECLDASRMKSNEDVAKIIERHMWAQWIRQMNYHTVTERTTTDKRVSATYGVPDLGAYIAEELNNVGVSADAGVDLGIHFYSQHEPPNWADLLRDWAQRYSEVLANG